MTIFKVNQKLVHLHGKAKKTSFEKFENSEAVTDETFPCGLQPAVE